MDTLRRWMVGGLAALVLSAFSWAAHAAPVSYSWDLTYMLPGSVGSYGTVATVSLTGEDAGSSVDFTVTNSMNLTGAFLTRLWLSDSALTTTAGLSFSNYGPYLPSDTADFVGPEGMSIGGAPQGYSGLNLQIDFSANPPRFYTAADGGPGTVTFTLNGVNILDFGKFVSGNNGPDSPVMVMLQAPGGLSFHYVSAVPEPNTYLLMFLGVGLMGLVVRRKLV